MRRRFVRAVAAVMAAAVLMPVFTGCDLKSGRTGKKVRKISADTPWYEAKVISPDLGFDENREKSFSHSSVIGSDEKNVIVYTSGNYKLPDDYYGSQDYEWKDFEISSVSVINIEKFETVRTIDLTKVVKGSDSIYSVYYSDGKIIGVLFGTDEKTFATKYTEVVIDPATGEIEEERAKSGDSQSSKVFNVLGYKISVADIRSEGHDYCKLDIVSSDGVSKTSEMKEPGKDIYEVNAVFALSKDKVMMPVTANTGMLFFELDLESGVITKCNEEDYAWMDISEMRYAFTAPDGNVYYNTPLGIFKIDLDRKAVEQAVDYSWSEVNRKTLINLDLIDVRDGSYILAGCDYKYGPFGSFGSLDFDFILTSFKKADRNPHTGKTVLELYCSQGYVDEETCSQINAFNNTNGNCFIEVTDKYSQGSSKDHGDANSNDEADRLDMEYYSQIGNRLAMDMINGVGPDIFLNVSQYDSLKNGECLADLMPYLGDLDSGKYFTNIIDLAKDDGKLYNLPLCFGVTGIHTDSKYAGKSGVGFTTEEYEVFLKDTLNGKDVITSGQSFYFAKLFDYMKEKFITNGKADLTAPEFKVLAEYVKDNVPESSISWDVTADGEEQWTYQDVTDDGPVNNIAVYYNCGGYYDYAISVEQLNDATSILGLPSADGRGPMVSPKRTVAVSAHACDIDACAEFVKMLLSDEVQTGYAMRGDLVLNREVFRDTGDKAAQYFNSIILPKTDSVADDITYTSQPANNITFTSQHIDALEECIMSCSAMSSQDADITKILIEEMPAYFSGQKELDSVVVIMQDRVQKVLDERG